MLAGLEEYLKDLCKSNQPKVIKTKIRFAVVNAPQNEIK